MSQFVNIEPELREYLVSISEEVARQNVAVGDLAGMRRASAAARMSWQSGGPSISSRNLDNLGIPARLFRNSAAGALPILVYLHGGGWVMFGPDTHDRLLREYALASGWAVLALDFPLAPEAPFPQALDAIAAALEQLEQRADNLGIDCSRMVIAGDSSGANLALALALKFPTIPLLGLLLIYAVLDSDTSRGSYQRHSASPHLLTADKMQFFWANYCQEDGDRISSFAAPLRATDDQLRSVPPTCMIIADQDVLADENEEMAARLEKLGGRPFVLRFPSATHAFMEAISVSPIAREALEASVRWLLQLASMRT